MILKVYTVKDAKAEAYLTPFYQHTTALALRQFEDMVKNPEHPFAKHPEDYSLWKIGDYDDLKGQLINLELNEHLANAIDISHKE